MLVTDISKCWFECCLSTRSWSAAQRVKVSATVAAWTRTALNRVSIWSDESETLGLYRWGSTGPLRPAAAGSSPPPPHSDGRCCKALLEETQGSKVVRDRNVTMDDVSGEQIKRALIIHKNNDKWHTYMLTYARICFSAKAVFMSRTLLMFTSEFVSHSSWSLCF